MIASSYTIPGYTVVTTSDGMHLLVPQPRAPIAVDFVPMPMPEPIVSRWLVPQRLGGTVPVRPQQIVVMDPAASGIDFRRRSRRGFAPPRKRPRRVAKRIAARGGRMHYPRKKPTP